MKSFFFFIVSDLPAKRDNGHQSSLGGNELSGQKWWIITDGAFVYTTFVRTRFQFVVRRSLRLPSLCVSTTGRWKKKKQKTLGSMNEGLNAVNERRHLHSLNPRKSGFNKQWCNGQNKVLWSWYMFNVALKSSSDFLQFLIFLLRYFHVLTNLDCKPSYV